ncbi:endonuclease domain-containing protein [Rhodococcus sp. TAF43]|uniref:endonuclease domain-containing protein n=1 Tax=unclassified Rhodococcus (in: high G+C Gram-positive bacteria) TaxID=192944 RepID=UPI00158355FE|nr:DUF559 domain-containing protein [Rhodococcus sp. W8901]QKT12573.1 DUF559 domain-containing protein [Rhodococcus sp. W8901]
MNHFGVHTFEELTAAGVPPSTIGSRCRTGRYRRVLPRVYATGEPKILEATVPPNIRARAPEWLRIHRLVLDPAEVVECRSLPTVSSTQALVDCATVMPAPEFEPLVDAEPCRSVNPVRVRDLCTAHPGRWGNTAAVAQLRVAAVRAESEPERILARAFHARRCPLAANEAVGPYVCDFVDAPGRVVVEVDGREFHSAPEVFRSDRRRQNWLVRQGWLVLRYAAYDVLEDSGRVADEVVEVVRRRRHARR